MEFPAHLSWLKDDPLAELHALKLARLSQGQELFDVSMINPDLPPPRYILDKLSEATIKPDNHRYAVSRGVRKLREGFASKYERRFGVKLSSEEEICVTMGTKDAILHAAMCVTKPGDSVLLPKPVYPAHLSAIRIAELKPSFFELSGDEDQMFWNVSSRLQTGRYRLLILNFPNNPTGLTVSRSFYERLVEVAQASDCFVINDFVYGEMGFKSDAPASLLSVANRRENIAETYSLSKAYSVPGWRVGALLGSSTLAQKLARLKGHIDYGIFLPVQLAAAAGLSGKDELAAGIARQYMNRAGLLVTGLKRLGWEVTMPAAGASVWARMPEFFREEGSRGFVRRLLTECGVMLMPGELFGEEYGGYARFALVQSETKLLKILACLESLAPVRQKQEQAAAAESV